MKTKNEFSDIFLENALLLENLQGGIVYSDFEDPFILRYVTEGMTNLSGYSQEELLAMGQMELVKEDEVEKLAEDVATQFSVGDTFEVEYNLKCKDGTFVYVLDRAKIVEHEDGKKYIHCLLTDISKLKKMEQDLRLSEEKYKLAIQESGSVIIELDVLTRQLSFSENYEKIFKAPAPQGTLEQIVSSEWIMPSYQEDFMAVFSNKGLVEGNSIELKLRDGSGNYVWCQLHVTPVYQSNQAIYSYVGCLQNVDEQKQHLDHLTQLSQIDGLTGVYNRITIENFINEHIQNNSENKTGALIILDVDFFKQINDTLGHSYGDRVLMEISRTIKKLLPKEAFLGRLGGDEFLIYFSNIRTESDIQDYAKMIMGNIQTVFSGKEYAVTVSMGIALKCEELLCFNDFYKRADIALYQTKSNGRNGYYIYK